MNPRLFCQLVSAGLLLVSCDKSSEKGLREANPESSPAVTKSPRNSRETSPQARKKLRESLEEAGRIASPAERNPAIAAIVWNQIELDPKLAAEAFQQLNAGAPERVRLVQHLVMRLAENDIEAAIRWADALENPEEIALAYGKISLVLAETDPQRAANLLSESGMAGREFDVALVQVVQRWAAEKPADAAAWIVLFDSGEARSASMNAVVSQWSKRDVSAAFGWVASLENAALRDEAQRAMAEAILEQPPATQDEWIHLASPEIRSELEKLQQPVDQDTSR